ncbi:MAG: hypothetical protein AAFP90_15840, partial [Planctomycetota bacterium]
MMFEPSMQPYQSRQTSMKRVFAKYLLAKSLIGSLVSAIACLCFVGPVSGQDAAATKFRKNRNNDATGGVWGARFRNKESSNAQR